MKTLIQDSDNLRQPASPVSSDNARSERSSVFDTVNLSLPFIRRPLAASPLAAGLATFGLLAYEALPALVQK